MTNREPTRTQFLQVGNDIHDSLTLKDGRQIVMESIFQTKTYGGVYLGQPNAELNQAILTSALKHAVKLFMAPCIAVSTTIESATLGRQRLAPISCIGLFTSAKPIHSPDRGGSKLAMVWFQSDYGLPKSEEFFGFVETLDWSLHARDFDL